ncbi:Gfo/Idh/MocA family protein [Terricaulis sp.]|uniref:Gfo/Idh/MocA family protein n=1 Tax=Terricaulis sp. TaxID=2768686 RepID=UPI00378395AF
MKRRIAVIGLGQRIAHVLAAMAEVGWPLEIVGYADPSPVGVPVLHGAGLSEGNAFASAAALLAAGPFDLVMIGSPNHLHLEHLDLARRAGFPIFIEKPVVRTEEESLALAATLDGGGPPIFVGLVMRSMPIVRETLKRVRDGAIGALISIDATEHLHPEHGGYLARNWRRRQDWGGSFLLDKVCHDFDIFSCLAGARAARVASFGGRAIFQPQSPARSAAHARHDAGWSGAGDAFASDMDVTDHQVAIVEYANGVRLSFHANTNTALQERRWYIAGTQGTLIADLVRNRLMMRRTDASEKPERIDFGERTADLHNGADQAMARDLAAALDGAPFPVTVEESLEAGLTVMAIDQAMASGAVVDCGSIWKAYDAARHVR